MISELDFFLIIRQSIKKKNQKRDIIFFFAELPMWYANGQNYTRFKLSNALGISVELCSLGATVTAVNVPDSNGHFKDVILGFDNAKDYLNSPKTYFGATVGRVANR